MHTSESCQQVRLRVVLPSVPFHRFHSVVWRYTTVRVQNINKLALLYLRKGMEGNGCAEPPLKKIKAPRPRKRKCLFYTQCHKFLLAGETVKCNTCSQSVASESTNKNRSLLSHLPSSKEKVDADDAQEALGAILEIIQMGAPARVTAGSTASQSGTCDTMSINNFMHELSVTLSILVIHTTPRTRQNCNYLARIVSVSPLISK